MNAPAVTDMQQVLLTRIIHTRRQHDEQYDRRPGEWSEPAPVKLAVLMAACGDTAQALLLGDRDALEEQLLDVAAVALCWLESQDLDEYENLEG